MDVLHTCCAGLDVHKRTVVATVRRVNPAGKVSRTTETFATMTRDLLDLSDWLAGQGVTILAMESTDSYWKPVFNILEPSFQVVLVDAHHIKQVPGRKTDVKDSEWIAQLLQHGLLRPSFVPPRPTCELRDLTRQRTQLLHEKAAVANRIQKVLEDANIKLGSVAIDVLGVSGRDMIRAMIGGQDDPARLAYLARRSLRGKIPELKRALRGPGHRAPSLRAGGAAGPGRGAGGPDRAAGRADRGGDAAVRRDGGPAAGDPRGGGRAAEVILGEIGPDVETFPTAGHLSSWAGLCPGNNESADKRRSGKTTKGSQWLRTTLVQVSWAASRAKGTIFQACYQRWVKRLGRKKALVAHRILVVIRHLLKKGTDYRERRAPAPAA